MTPATPLTRRQARVALAAAGCAIALVLTGCGSGSGSGDSGGGAAATPGAPSAAASVAGGGSPSPSEEAGKLAGSWLATTGGKAVALVINGGRAGLFTTNGTVCGGTAGEESGMQMIHLTCQGGSENRSTGMVDAVTSGSMKVTWEGGLGTETYTRTEGGKLPSGLPRTPLRS